MKASFSWIKEWAELPWSASATAEKLIELGFLVEHMERTGVQAEGIVVAQIKSVEKHPNADRLRLAQVTDGTGERTIVCGAPNISPGQVVPLAFPAPHLPW